jgi:glycosyltransferase involved in cell wall biosynthesis
MVITPNAERSRALGAELGIAVTRLQTVWNTPRRAELPALPAPVAGPLVVYYHGSIVPDRLPKAIAAAVRRFAGQVALKVAGYETPGGEGHVADLIESGGIDPNGRSMINFLGAIPRDDLLTVATHAHVGLALMPMKAEDINMRHMTGASNKAFDYMAAGLPLLVSDLPEWRTMFVEPGYALACNPNDPDSIAAALAWFLDHEAERRAMGARGRAKIEADWNYETAFAPILGLMSDMKLVGERRC